MAILLRFPDQPPVQPSAATIDGRGAPNILILPCIRRESLEPVRQDRVAEQRQA